MNENIVQVYTTLQYFAAALMLITHSLYVQNVDCMFIVSKTVQYILYLNTLP